MEWQFERNFIQSNNFKEEKRMKKFILSMTMLVLVLCLKTNISNAAEISAMERLDYWDVSKEYTITDQYATYHA